MELLTEFDKVEEALAARDELASRGIAAWVFSAGTGRLEPGLRAGLWVCDDAQAEEAWQCLLNPDYVVAKPYTQEEIAEIWRIQEEAAQQTGGVVMRWALISAVVLAGVAALVTWLALGA